jgi:hypothetical protein
MYKSACVVVVLLAAFAFKPGSMSDASPTTAIGPAIVARGKLLNQTAPIPTTTIFTPTQTGLYRLSVYATITTSDPISQSAWYFNYSWSDDAGPQVAGGILFQSGASFGEFNNDTSTLDGGQVKAFEAKAGTPITYSMTQAGASDSSAFSLYYTVERLE